jgi:branched-chain amino acid transport system substrate-binding protein
MELKSTAIAALLAAASAAWMGQSQAQTVKIGVGLPYTGVGAEFGQQIDRGIQLFMKLNPDAFGPCKVEIVKRDVKNPGGADARTAVQEMIAQDKVDIVTGGVYSSNAIAIEPVITAAKKPFIVMNAGTAWITNLSPYIARVSFSMWHASHTLGHVATSTLKAKTAVVGYTDYPAGKDSLAAFKVAFEGTGGRVLDEIPMGGPGQVPDFTPFLQRAKSKKPDVFFVFVPGGDHSTALVKTYAALGFREAGIRMIAPGDVAQDTKLQSLGDDAIGLITVLHYNADLEIPANTRFVAAWKREFGSQSTPDFQGVQGYDGMAAIAHAARAQNCKIDSERTMAVLKGWKYDASPRGPLMIDPATRDVIMNEYVSEVIKKDGRLVQKNIGVITAVKDMCKELKVERCGK